MEVELGAELVDVRQDADGAEAVLADGRRIAAEYVVACDGGRSTVRKLLGIPFVGEGDPEPVMVCGDVEVEGLEPGAWHQWFGPQGVFMLCPFEGSPRWQLQASPETAADGTMVPPSLESFQRLAATHTGRDDIRLSDATWLSTWRVNVRMAERYREGRVLLAGDCAHVHPTAGGLGMNTGIQDAWNLAWKLGHVVRGLAGPALLDTYQEERLPIAAWTLDVTSAGMAAVTEGIDTPGIGVEAAWGRRLHRPLPRLPVEQPRRRRRHPGRGRRGGAAPGRGPGARRPLPGPGRCSGAALRAVHAATTSPCSASARAPAPTSPDCPATSGRCGSRTGTARSAGPTV